MSDEGLFPGLFKAITNPSMLALRRDLEQRAANWTRPGYQYAGGGDFLLKHGTFYPGRQLPDQYAHLFGAPNACFANALLVAKENPDLRYCEGVYAAHGGFVPHAWLVDPDGELVEVTWPTRPDQGTEKFHDSLMKMSLVAPERMAYCGAFFRWELVEWFVENYGEFCLLDRPSHDVSYGTSRGMDMSQCHDNPILKVPYDPDRVTL